MGQYRISELNLEIETNSDILINNLKGYEAQFDCKPNLKMSITDDTLLRLMSENKGYTADYIECEYMAMVFSRALFDFNGFPLRSVAVESNGKAVLFSSPFEEQDIVSMLPADKIFDINYPAIRLIDSTFFVYDTPFGIKGNMARKTRLPLKSIVFVDSERFSSLVKLEPKDFIALFMRAVTLNIYNERTKHTLFMLEKLMHNTQFFGVCNLNDIDFIFERV